MVTFTKIQLVKESKHLRSYVHVGLGGFTDRLQPLKRSIVPQFDEFKLNRCLLIKWCPLLWKVKLWTLLNPSLYIIKCIYIRYTTNMVHPSWLMYSLTVQYYTVGPLFCTSQLLIVVYTFSSKCKKTFFFLCFLFWRNFCFQLRINTQCERNVCK